MRRSFFLTHLPVARQPLRSKEERIAAPYRVDEINGSTQPLLLLVLVQVELPEEVTLNALLGPDPGEQHPCFFIREPLLIDAPQQREGMTD